MRRRSTFQFQQHSRNNKDHLEDVVLDVVDLDLLLGASSGSARRQQRLESESKEIFYFFGHEGRRLRQTRSTRAHPNPARAHPPVGGRDQQDSVAVERLPLHHEGHVRHLAVVQEMRVCGKKQVFSCARNTDSLPL